MKLSILDQSPILPGKTPTQALQESLQLAQLGERLGYKRYWIAEHHDVDGLVCPAPEVMISYIGAQTKKIRLGAGAVLLPHYRPYRVAETFNMLATLFPNRIDLGIGRAPGGSAEATIALSGNFLEKVRNLPKDLKELINFLHLDFPKDHTFAKIKPSPVPVTPPKVWVLGTSEKSAKLAAENGTAYAFGQFMSEKSGAEIIKTYKENFQGRTLEEKPHTIVAISVICAETSEAAEDLAYRSFLWKNQIVNENVKQIKEKEQMFAKVKSNMVIGNPQEVLQKLHGMQETHGADEIMIITITNNFESRMQSYELIAQGNLS